MDIMKIHEGNKLLEEKAKLVNLRDTIKKCNVLAIADSGTRHFSNIYDADDKWRCTSKTLDKIPDAKRKIETASKWYYEYILIILAEEINVIDQKILSL